VSATAEKKSAVKIEIESEKAISKDPARVLVYENEKLVEIIIAQIDLQQGADGRYYPCIILKKQNLP